MSLVESPALHGHSEVPSCLAALVNPGCRVGGGIVFLFVPISVIYGLVFLGTLPAPARGLALHLLDWSPPFVATSLEAGRAYPCLWGKRWPLTFRIEYPGSLLLSATQAVGFV